MEPEDAALLMPVQEESDVSDDESVDDRPTFGGFDFEFVDKLSFEQKCSICLVAMRNPVQTVCGHRFCKDCLLGTFSDHGHRACPQDRKSLPDEGGFFNDVAWERNILSLRVKCKRNKRGCNWTGQLRHYQNHSDECEYEDVTCGDCYEEMQRRFLGKHLSLECQERIVQCDHCEEEFAFFCLKYHERNECTRFPVKCPQRCGVQGIPREEVKSHIKEDCSMTVVACPYKGAGCTFRGKRVNLKGHIANFSEVHLRKTWSAFLNTKHELDEVKGQVKEMKVRVNTLKSEKEAIKKGLERITKFVKRKFEDLEKNETEAKKPKIIKVVVLDETPIHKRVQRHIGGWSTFISNQAMEEEEDEEDLY